MSRMWLAWISQSLNLDIRLRARRVGVLRRADDLDDLVEVVERDQQAQDDVVALLGLAQVEPRAPRDDVDLVIDVVAHHLGQVQRARDAVDERQHDHAEACPAAACACRAGSARPAGWRRASVSMTRRMPSRFGLVLEVGDVLDLPVLTRSAIFSASRALFTWYGSSVTTILFVPFWLSSICVTRAHAHRAAAGLVGVADALAAHDRAAGREVRALDELHQLAGRGLGIVEVVRRRRRSPRRGCAAGCSWPCRPRCRRRR